MANDIVSIVNGQEHIYDKSIYKQFDKYIKLCTPIHDPDGLEMINQLGSYIGASNKDSNYYNSEMLEKLSLGIVTHHGSMPLTARLILEHFTQRGFCRICFATSTLEQGINMPFDVDIYPLCAFTPTNALPSAALTPLIVNIVSCEKRIRCTSFR